MADHFAICQILILGAWLETAAFDEQDLESSIEELMRDADASGAGPYNAKVSIERTFMVESAQIDEHDNPASFEAPSVVDVQRSDPILLTDDLKLMFFEAWRGLALLQQLTSQIPSRCLNG